MALSACGGQSVEQPERTGPAPPAEWPLYQAHCGYSFRGPADLREIPSQRVDSCVEMFATAACNLQSEFGCCSNPRLDESADRAEYRSSSIVVDGMEARLVTWRAKVNPQLDYAAAIHFPSVVLGEKNAAKLTLLAGCATVAARDEIVTLLWSIRFP